MIVSHTHSNWITSKKLKLFDELGINQTILYFNPTALEHTIPTVQGSPIFVPALPSSRTRAILRWLGTIGITFDISFLNKTDLKSLWRGIQGALDYIPVKTL